MISINNKESSSSDEFFNLTRLEKFLASIIISPLIIIVLLIIIPFIALLPIFVLINPSVLKINKKKE